MKAVKNVFHVKSLYMEDEIMKKNSFYFQILFEQELTCNVYYLLYIKYNLFHKCIDCWFFCLRIKAFTLRKKTKLLKHLTK